MPLMDRIDIEPFHQMGLSQQYELIEKVRKKRGSALEHARTTKGKGMTKSAAKNVAKKKGKKAAKNPEKKANAALAKLTPEQIAKIAGML